MPSHTTSDGERLIYADREGQISFKESVLRQTERRSDNWGNDVSFRSNSIKIDPIKLKIRDRNMNIAPNRGL